MRIFDIRNSRDEDHRRDSQNVREGNWDNQTSHGLTQTSDRLNQASDRHNQASDRIYQASAAASLYYYPVSAHTTSAAYTNRHSPGILPEYDPSCVRRAYRHYNQFRCYPQAFTEYDYCESMASPASRRLYHQAREELECGGRVRSHVQPFTKIEKMATSKYKAPRLIQARHISFNIKYGRFIKALEHRLTKNHKRSVNFGKGNYNELAHRITTLAKKYTHYTELDHKSFDAHVTVDMLKNNTKFYAQCFPGHAEEIRRYGRAQLNNKCITRNGDRWTIKGTVMSGDVTTSIGNCLINYSIIKESLKMLGIRGDVLVNGDDCIIFTNCPIPCEFESILRKFNMEATIGNTSTDIHDIEFCRAKVILNDLGQYTMMINPERLEQIFGMTYNNIPSYQDYLLEVIQCNACINKSNPIGGMWFDLYNRLVKDVHNKNYQYIKTINEINPKKFKNIARPLLRTVLKNEKTLACNGEITQSCIKAYPSVLMHSKKLDKIYYKIRLLYMIYPERLSSQYLYETPLPTRTLIIDHAIRTIQGY
uniref:RNA-directed RNA polymerase n=1 Tax=Hymenopteran tombus-related virus TaxID=2822555 RepID=A0A8A6RSZ6_9TOMB|nr:RNA-dependent RNA polymerase [Hymenopteran tombus-related virus]